MQIRLNGILKQINDSSSIASLVGSLALNPKQVAIEHNQEIVPRSSYDRILLAEGDRVEIVHFIGGG